jgi:oxygen-independent coproporphyrinogen III oxidase
MAPLPPGSPLGIYIHIPFCSHICPYCDFNTYQGQEGLIPRYVDAVSRDIERHGEILGQRAAGTIYLGGGTPSLLLPEQVNQILSSCRGSFTLAQHAEITMESNPNSLDRERLAGYRAAGVNRLSIGVQTLDRRGLRVLGRQHEAADVQSAYRAARDAGFGNVSLDLIFGWPGQSVESWRNDLDQALDWEDGGPEHLSLYSLIVEPGTPMADAVQRGILTPVDDDSAADFYEAAIERLDRAGWAHYEVANWCREPGLMSRHNLLYWRNGEYAAFGAGAHGRVGEIRSMNHLLPRTYVEAIESGQPSVSNQEVLTPQIEMGETMMLGLRLLQEGVADSVFKARHGVGLRERYGDMIDKLTRVGLIAWDGEVARLTDRGLMLANDVCSEFL